jgi:hypothetical protein
MRFKGRFCIRYQKNYSIKCILKISCSQISYWSSWDLGEDFVLDIKRIIQ